MREDIFRVKWSKFPQTLEWTKILSISTEKKLALESFNLLTELWKQIKVSRILKGLSVRHVFLWNTFHLLKDVANIKLSTHPFLRRDAPKNTRIFFVNF